MGEWVNSRTASLSPLSQTLIPLYPPRCYCVRNRSPAIPTPDNSTGVTNVLGGLTFGKIVPAGLPSAPLKRAQLSRDIGIDGVVVRDNYQGFRA
jgi:hypothetical protein